MKLLRLYLDTTVWNYPFADDSPDHQQETVEFFAKVRLGQFEICISDAVLEELADAPSPRRELMMDLVREIEPKRLEATAEIERLAAVYVARAVLPPRSSADALHIAYATVNELDYLLSWNFRHLANSTRKARVAAVNIEEGYRFPTVIATPLEVLGAE